MAVLVSIFTVAVIDLPLSAQSTQNRGEAFEVASVKRNTSGNMPRSNFPLNMNGIYAHTGGVFSATDFPLITYVLFAYDLAGYDLDNVAKSLPVWGRTERFDIDARAEGNPTKDEMRLMVRKLLADRFKLDIHTETQEISGLALRMSKPGVMGPRLRRHLASAQCPDIQPPAPAGPGQQTPKVEMDADGFPVVCGGIVPMPGTEVVRLGARNITISTLASSLPSMGRLDAPVFDETNLGGTFDFTLEYANPPLRLSARTDADSQPDTGGPTITDALTEQLGLKLQRAKGRITLHFVDHVEHPSEN
jgi:uncharacterized protein (TIGR03435 family)